MYKWCETDSKDKWISKKFDLLSPILLTGCHILYRQEKVLFLQAKSACGKAENKLKARDNGNEDMGRREGQPFCKHTAMYSITVLI